MFPDFVTEKNTHTGRVSGFQQGARMGELLMLSWSLFAFFQLLTASVLSGAKEMELRLTGPPHV